eukprot:TRINITY_DN13842_c0_g1_i1.p1 TRINITY_DN13842_c0_g1~~TRINITY_DN13842_c0_g1_i1.p1  ORF type:complete len:101 (-),score=0.61 TRINITY_DN13842_c0_g1_i1:183-485(-)
MHICFERAVACFFVQPPACRLYPSTSLLALTGWEVLVNTPHLYATTPAMMTAPATPPTVPQIHIQFLVFAARISSHTFVIRVLLQVDSNAHVVNLSLIHI